MRILALIVLISIAPVHGLENTEANRLAQGNRYLEATPPTEMISDMAKNMAQSMPEAKRAEFIEVMTKRLDLTSLRKTMLNSMVKHFTADELKALADFYGSPIGKSAMKKFGPYMSDVMPKIQQEVMKAFADFMSPTAPK